jgi:hypothetical protein
VICAYEDQKDGEEIVDIWHAENKKQAESKPQSKDKSKAVSKDDSTKSARRSGFSKPCTDTNFKLVVAVDAIQDLEDCPKVFQYGKQFLPDLAIKDVPSEMQRMQNWYMRACRLGLRTISAPYYSKIFGPPGVGITWHH